MNLFYADPGDIQGQSLVIQGQEASHIRKVLRFSIGDMLHVTDGEGKQYQCRIRDYYNDQVLLDILNVEKEETEQPDICLCIGIIKKRDRMEFAVEKVVELGVKKIVFYRGEHSQKENVRKERLINTAISAMKQSLRLYRPEIFVEDSLQKALSTHSAGATIIVADERLDREREPNADPNYFLVVGPEGGFSDKERETLEGFGPEYYSLGKKRLRTETAAIIMADRFTNLK